VREVGQVCGVGTEESQKEARPHPGPLPALSPGERESLGTSLETLNGSLAISVRSESRNCGCGTLDGVSCAHGHGTIQDFPRDLGCAIMGGVIPMRLSEMKEILADGRLRLTKSLGQNFLHDANQLRRIIAAAELTKADRVLEIGPGLGPLTEMLVAESGEILAIEKDGRLVEILRRRLGSVASITLIHDDALAWLRRERRDWSGWKLVANLPYSVASPILVELAKEKHGPGRLVVTLQMEVAQRLLAHPGERDYGVLTLLVQLNYAVADWFKIPAGCFFPQPDVDSACVSLERRREAGLSEELFPAYLQVVKRAFSQRRKMMFKLLKKDWPVDRLTQAYEALGLSQQARAETLSRDQFAQLTAWLGSPSTLRNSP